MVKVLYHLIKNHGWKYLYHRIFYELERRWVKQEHKFPTNPTERVGISLEEWKVLNPPFFFQSREEVQVVRNPTDKLKKSYEKIRNGEFLFFNHSWKPIGSDYDWITHPITKYKYDIRRHWTKISDFSEASGDIKYVWEKSRFSYLHTIVRYDHHCKEDSSSFVLNEISNWIDKNPINQGPNYRCSQEISLRILNWTFALYFYKNSSALTEDFFRKIINSIYWQIHHVRQNVNFSRRFVRNNHAIAETALLYLSGFIFPFFDQVGTWSSEGKHWLQEELMYQIAEDGTFIQHSHNYHRVLLQLLSWIFYLAEKNGDTFEPEVVHRCRASVEYLKNMIEGNNGQVPNYGPNDGALFFPLSGSDYSDFRPSVHAAYHYFNRRPLFKDPRVTEELQWYGADVSEYTQAYEHPTGIRRYDDGGIYSFREEDTFTFIKCSDNRHRPYQCDNLHLDIWYKGINLLRDAGTYLYNTDRKTESYFLSGKAHNTITVGAADQMERGPRFIWFNWSRAKVLDIGEDEGTFYFKGEMSGFRSSGSWITVGREVIKSKNRPVWEVFDYLKNEQNHSLHQWWHPNSAFTSKIKIEATSHGEPVIPVKAGGFYSAYYGHRTPSPVVQFTSSKGSIRTIISCKSD